MRKSLEESWQAVEAMGHDMPRLPDGTPHLPSRVPNFDDEEPVNIAFFRTMWEDADLSGFTLPRMYFARSGFERVNFGTSELAESRMCWNDFIHCDFSNADLARCDMRASNFDGCVFRGADLSGADLRRSNFDACIFEGAKMAGAIVHKRSADDDLIPLLSKSQLEEIRWVSEEGEEPPGG
ncbi:MAG: pentapeptide repeat family protein [Phycisphaerales bacterium]|nr:pentapeptide repeat family protein [Phycisphaerales bacterium]